MKKHKNFDTVCPYTYYVMHKETGLKYYGVRWGNIKYNRTPNEDFLNFYFTSISSEKFKWFKDLLIKDKSLFDFRLHYAFDNKDDAIIYECNITKKIYLKSDWVNLCSGKAICIDHISNEDMSIRKKAGWLKVKGKKFNISEKRKEQLRNHCKSHMQNSGEDHPLFSIPVSEERRENISNGLKEFYKENPGFNSGPKNAMYGKGKNYKAISPNGEMFIIKEGICQFCKDRDISYTSMKRYIEGKQKSTVKGWKFYILPD